MRLKKTLNREMPDGKRYYRWLVDLPPRAVEAMGWDEGEDLEAVPKGDALLIRPKQKGK